MKFEGKDMLDTLEGCDLVWPVTAAELYRINLNQVFETKKDLKLDATIRFCNGQKLKHFFFILR